MMKKSLGMHNLSMKVNISVINIATHESCYAVEEKIRSNSISRRIERHLKRVFIIKSSIKTPPLKESKTFLEN